MSEENNKYHIIDELFAVIESRKDSNADESYVSSLFHKGIDKISGKLAEESAETIIEAVRGDREKICFESADLLFHLMVLWSHSNVHPEDIFSVLEQRFGTSGHEEKKKRKDKEK